jgi:hypothetical protein
VIRKAYTFIPFEFYDVNAKGRAVSTGTPDMTGLERDIAAGVTFFLFFVFPVLVFFWRGA